MRAVVVGCVSFLVGLLVLGVFPNPSPAQTAETQKRFVVVFKGTKIPPGAGSLIESAGGKLARIFPEVGIAVAVSDSSTFPKNLSRSGLVEAVGEDREHPLPDRFAAEFESEGSGSALAFLPDPNVDTLFFRQWHIRRVRADAAWAAGVTGSTDIVVAIIDTGIASNHPDLAPNLRFSHCFSQAGVEDPPSCSPYPNILSNPITGGGSHGTLVAGIIAAAFGHGRVVGVGPNLSIASYNVFEADPNGAPRASEAAIWAAMYDAAGLDEIPARPPKAQVINLSLGDLILFPSHDERCLPSGPVPGKSCDAALWTAWVRIVDRVTRQGVTIIASAGNEGISTNGPVAHVPSDVPGVISVGATGIRACPFVDPQHVTFDVLGTMFQPSDGTIREVPYSDFGGALDLVAPGGDRGSLTLPQCFLPDSPPGTPPEPRTSWGIQSTGVMSAPGCAASANCTTVYVRGLFGTSFAAPHVAGVAGLILSQNPNLRPQQVAAILKRTAQPIGDRQHFGAGMVDAAAAVGMP